MNRLKMVCLTILFTTTTLLNADGLNVKKWLTLKEMVSRSPCIFVAEIIAAKHKWGKRRAYRRNNKYIIQYRFKVRVVKYLKNTIPTKKEFWIKRGGGYIPGVWLLVKEMYRESFNPFTAKIGQRCIVYLRKGNQKQLYFDGFDSLDKINKISVLYK